MVKDTGRSLTNAPAAPLRSLKDLAVGPQLALRDPKLTPHRIRALALACLAAGCTGSPQAFLEEPDPGFEAIDAILYPAKRARGPGGMPFHPLALAIGLPCTSSSSRSRRQRLSASCSATTRPGTWPVPPIVPRSSRWTAKRGPPGSPTRSSTGHGQAGPRAWPRVDGTAKDSDPNARARGCSTWPPSR
ncbi:hypothetical protein OAX78_00660 [Planctomycetota bacterium]|nr:hypothetical protein [Planctomycetota bacterium]